VEALSRKVSVRKMMMIPRILTQVRRHLMWMKRVLKCVVSGLGAGFLGIMARMLFHSSVLA
jgi:hypothetical protein